MSKWIRPFHRWNVYRLHTDRHRQLRRHGAGDAAARWLASSPLLPLFLLMLTGLYMFALPYAARWRSARSAGG